MKKIVYFILVLTLTSCGFGSKSEVERLRAENDSLAEAKVNLEQEVNEYFSTLTDVQQNIQKIKDAQNVLNVDPLKENAPKAVQNKVKEDIAYINQLIQSNKETLSDLQTKLKRSSFKLADLEKTVLSLTEQLNEESTKVASLTVQNQEKDSVITELNVVIDSLDVNLKDATEDNIHKKEMILEKEAALNSAWYAIGSKKELKENSIITTKGLFNSKQVLVENFNKDYFVKIDIRKDKSIPLYSKSKVKVLTTHPVSSYAIEQDAETGNQRLVITDPAEFWGISKYLVIQID